MIASRDLEKLKVAADEMSKVGQVTPVKCNIRNEDEVKYVISFHIDTPKMLHFVSGSSHGIGPL